MANLGNRSLLVVGQTLHDDSAAARTKTLVCDELELARILTSQKAPFLTNAFAVDRTLNVFFGHTSCLGCGNRCFQFEVLCYMSRRVHINTRIRASLLHGTGNTFGQLCIEIGPFDVFVGLIVLNGSPVRVARKITRRNPLFVKIHTE